MPYLPELYTGFRHQFPAVDAAYEALALACHEAGPLDEKTRRLVKLGIAVGAQSEGAVRSHARKAMEAGATREEVRHAVLLALTTIGFPHMSAALRWVEGIPEPASG